MPQVVTDADSRSISSLIDYDTAERLPASAFARRVLPQTPPDLPLIDGELQRYRKLSSYTQAMT